MEAALASGMNSNNNNSDDESSINSEETLLNRDWNLIHNYGLSLVQAAQEEEWEAQQIGNLVRLLALSRWGVKSSKKTSAFLKRYISTLVNPEFLEGLGVPLENRHLLSVLRASTPSNAVFRSKIAECLEGSYLDMSSPNFTSDLMDIGYLPSSSANIDETLEALLPLFENARNLSTCFQILENVTVTWHASPKLLLIQRVVTLELMLDIDGDLKRDVAKFFPAIFQSLTFPTLAAEAIDANADGNLKGFVVSSSSSEGDNDSEDVEIISDDEHYENMMIDLEADGDKRRGNTSSRSSNPFIESEAEEEDDDISDDSDAVVYKKRKRNVLDEEDSE